MLGQPFANTRLLGVVEPHPFLGTTPDSIISSTHPLMIDQITQLRLVEVMTKQLAKIVEAGAPFSTNSLLLP